MGQPEEERPAPNNGLVQAPQHRPTRGPAPSLDRWPPFRHPSQCLRTAERRSTSRV